MLETFTDIDNFFKERREIGIKLGLDRVIELLRLLGNPERDIDAIHIAGTNGKGSTIQFLQNSLISSEYRVGVFTSPSFSGLMGHFIIDGKQISEVELINLLNSILPAIEKMDDQPTEYEILTVMAFIYFKDNVDIALIETAMGGKEDTTNCFKPILSIITNVSIDHVDYLGSTIEAITHHKAGIIKTNRPVIVGEISAVSDTIIRNTARNLNAPTYFAGQDFEVNLETNSISSNSRNFALSLALQGAHQLKNASLVIEGLIILEKLGYDIKWAESIKAINTTVLPGRFEIISQKPKIILDSAHNIAGIKAFNETVEANYARSNKELIFSAFSDKQFPEMITSLTKTFIQISLTSFEHPRAATIRQLSVVVNGENVIYLDNWQEKITDILDSKEDKVHFITGSMHFIMLVRNFIIENEQYDQ